MKEISLCESCHCITKTINGKCGKCKAEKENKIHFIKNSDLFDIAKKMKKETGWVKNRIDSEYRKHKKLDWSKIAEAKIINTILDWCYKNNSIPMNEKYDLNKLIEVFGEKKGNELYQNFKKMSLCTTDGGWINVLKLQAFLKNNIK